jgi:hypothetical protein
VSLAPGTRLGGYEILTLIGVGGMGEVYRARDTRLDRDVAIKVLPESLSHDPDRLSRFAREAKAVAALSHPNILAIYDVGGYQGLTYAVTELLEGETLRDRLTSGPVPVRKAVDIAAQIARGLAAAHDRGVVHRDLKPANVFLLTDGHVKILDFGLARQTLAAVGSGVTETAAATDPGTVLGTVGYMAPEQVRGQAVDARADLFALGAVLYEMLTGQRAFPGATAADTMTAILREDPPELSTVRGEAVAGVDRVMRHCLEKNPAERFQNARDVAFALEAFSGTSVGSASGAMSALPARRSRAPWFAVGAVALAALGAGVLVGRALRPAPAPITFETKTWDEERVTNARFAPDGQTVVFSAARDDLSPHLYAIRPGTMTSQPLGEPGTYLLSVSSSGELAVLTHLNFPGYPYWGGTLARMTMDGAPRPRLDNVIEADWSPDGSTAAITRWVGGAVRLEYPIGHSLYERKGEYLSDLRLSPDGTRVAFFEHRVIGDDRGWVKVVGRSETPRTLAGEFVGLKGLAWSGDGRSVYFSAVTPGNEGYQPLVVNVEGTPRPHQAIANAGGMVVADVAHDGGVLVMRDEPRFIIRTLVPGEAQEREFPSLKPTVPGLKDSLTTDGKSLIFTDASQSAGTNYAVALRDLATSRVTRLGEGWAEGLSPDNKWVSAFIPSIEQMVLYPIGSGEPIKLPKGPIEHYVPLVQWFPNSKRVLLCGNEPATDPRCYEQDLAGGPPNPVTPMTPGGIIFFCLASDGRTLLVRKPDLACEVLTLGETAGRAAQGCTQRDYVIGWASDSRALFVQDVAQVPSPVTRVDPFTGARRFLRTVGPPNRSGILDVEVTQWTDDGRGYTYTYVLELSRLFVARGVGQ